MFYFQYLWITKVFPLTKFIFIFFLHLDILPNVENPRKLFINAVHSIKTRYKWSYLDHEKLLDLNYIFSKRKRWRIKKKRVKYRKIGKVDNLADKWLKTFRAFFRQEKILTFWAFDIYEIVCILFLRSRESKSYLNRLFFRKLSLFLEQNPQWPALFWRRIARDRQVNSQ